MSYTDGTPLGVPLLTNSYNNNTSIINSGVYICVLPSHRCSFLLSAHEDDYSHTGGQAFGEGGVRGVGRRIAGQIHSLRGVSSIQAMGRIGRAGPQADVAAKDRLTHTSSTAVSISHRSDIPLVPY